MTAPQEELTRLARKLKPAATREIMLPRLVAQAPPTPRAIEAANRAGVKALIVEYHQLPRLSGDPHEELGFHGTLILSAVMPDELLTRRETFTRFVETANLGFDAAVGWDMPVEIDIPEEEQRRNLEQCLEMTAELAARLEIPVIPLSKGATPQQADQYTAALAELGFKQAALHATEYLVAYRWDPLARRLLHAHLELLNSRFKRVLVIGALSPTAYRIVRRYDRARNSYAGAAWLIDAQRGRAYAGWRKVNLKRKTLSLPGARLEHPRDEAAIMVHNLDHALRIVHNQLQDIYAGLWDPDAVLPGRTVIAGDLHAGARGAMVEEFLQTLRSEHPDNVVLMGDIFDLATGSQIHLDAVKIFGELAQLDPQIVAVWGDAELSPEGYNNTMHNFLDALDAWRRLPTRQPLLFHMASLVQYMTAARRTALLDTPAGKIVVRHYLEGPNTPEAQARAAQALEEELGPTWLITGHTHHAWINPATRTANAGCWTKRGKAPTPGTYIVVEPDGALELVYAEA